MIEVSPATPDDAAALYDILADAVQHKHRHGDTAWQPGFSKDGVKWLIGNGTTYLARVDGRPAATFGLLWDDPQDKTAWHGLDPAEAGYVHRMAVSDDFRGRQMGEHILDWAADRVRQQKRQFLRLDCSADNEGLCRYYEGLGFVRVGTYHFEAEAGMPEYTAALYQRPL